MSRWKAWQITGGLSNPSKMPSYAWGIPAITCQIGSRLAEVAGSTCANCYALKGHFRRPNVYAAYHRRLDRFGHPDWVAAMIKLVYWQTAETGQPYFRWFDSGDLQSVEMLERIVEVCRGTPEIRHWLPTREYGFLAKYLRRQRPPPNLTIRVSAPLVDGPAPQQFGIPTSTVHSPSTEIQGFACPAAASQPQQCGDCRACWEPAVRNVSYPLH